jgi:protein gp37
VSEQSAIEWTDSTWNPVSGCSKVSPGCAHCYAEALTMRYAKGWKVPGLPWTPANAAENVVLKPQKLDEPLRWRKPRMVFVNSMSDLFHERLTGLPSESADTEERVRRDLELYAAREGEPRRPAYIAEVFAVMSLAPQHVFQVLTKRPKAMALLLSHANFWLEVNAARMRRRASVLKGGMSEYAAGTLTLPNVWLGTSIENRHFVERADWLRMTPAAIRFISAEPLLGPLVYDAVSMGTPAIPFGARCWSGGFDGPQLNLTDIDWLIVGGESGPGHRPIREEWVRDLRDACLAHRDGHEPGEQWVVAADGGGISHVVHEPRTAFFLKQWGGPRPTSGGRELDGRTWDEMPRPVSAESTPHDG